MRGTAPGSRRRRRGRPARRGAPLVPFAAMRGRAAAGTGARDGGAVAAQLGRQADDVVVERVEEVGGPVAAQLLAE